ncbi:MAG: methylenetetrahydrofolate reductase, partial [Lachnospiraceae bacterium]|nr:methylenetetrahydrofolate reductase [Lachnospiraceae bacterium]
MRIPDIMKGRMSFSFEVFPPKEDKPLEPLLKALEELYKFNPDFISCTYGAGGTNVGRNLEVLRSIKNRGETIPVTHFTCVGNSREDIRRQLDEYLSIGVDHLLALRGDLPANNSGTGGDFSYANELIAFIRAHYGDRFVIAIGAYPEKHIEAKNLAEDIAHLRIKQDAGADFIMTQLCFDTDGFRRWMDRIRRAGVRIPINAGVMPVTNKDSVIRMALSRNGCSIPRHLAEIISRYWDD